MGPRAHGACGRPCLSSLAAMSILRHLRDQRGQTSVEYLGMIAVVVAIVGVIIAAAPDIGRSIVDAINDQIDKILG